MGCWGGGECTYPVGEAVGGEVTHRVDDGVCLRWGFLLARSMDGVVWLVVGWEVSIAFG
jgi:hypothetical protein